MTYPMTQARATLFELESRSRLTPSINRKSAFELTAEDTAEVLSFLAERPVHTVVMTSFMRDNGLVSELNRGKFFGYRNAAGKLTAVALIGHSTLVEARSDDAMWALAIEAR